MQSDRLFAFVSRFPLQAKVPLLVIYWTRLSESLVSEDDIISQLGLNFILRDGPISSCEFQRISADHNFFDSKAISHQLCDRISEMIRRCDVTSLGLHYDISKILGEYKVINLFEDLMIRSQVKLFDIYLDSTNRIESREASANSCIMLKSHSRLFNHFITLFNRLILSIQETMTEFPLQCISFPAKEFCDLGFANNLRLDWNSDSRFSDMRLIFSKFLLPFPELPDAYNNVTLQMFYVKYANLVAFEPKYKDMAVLETTKIVNGCAASEWMTKFISFYTRIVLEWMSEELGMMNSAFLIESFSKNMDSYVYNLKKDTSLLLEQIIQDLSSKQNFSTHFRLAR